MESDRLLRALTSGGRRSFRPFFAQDGVFHTGDGLLSLIDACKAGNEKLVAMALSMGADPNEPAQGHYYTPGSTPLHVVLESATVAKPRDDGQDEAAARFAILRLLLDAGADFSKENSSGVTPLWLAVTRMQVKAAEEIAGAIESTHMAEGREDADAQRIVEMALRHKPKGFSALATLLETLTWREEEVVVFVLEVFVPRLLELGADPLDLLVLAEVFETKSGTSDEDKEQRAEEEQEEEKEAERTPITRRAWPSALPPLSEVLHRYLAIVHEKAWQRRKHLILFRQWTRDYEDKWFEMLDRQDRERAERKKEVNTRQRSAVDERAEVRSDDSSVKDGASPTALSVTRKKELVVDGLTGLAVRTEEDGVVVAGVWP